MIGHVISSLADHAFCFVLLQQGNIGFYTLPRLWAVEAGLLFVRKTPLLLQTKSSKKMK
jgi:hypothetical protein